MIDGGYWMVMSKDERIPTRSLRSILPAAQVASEPRPLPLARPATAKHAAGDEELEVTLQPSSKHRFTNSD